METFVNDMLTFVLWPMVFIWAITMRIRMSEMEIELKALNKDLTDTRLAMVTCEATIDRRTGSIRAFDRRVSALEVRVAASAGGHRPEEGAGR